MLLRSYTSDVDGNVDALRWVLFVRQEEQDSKDTFLVFTAAIEELGVEENVTTFQNLMLKTLEERKSVNVVVENEQETSGKPLEVLLELMYKFNASILRKGVFQLSVVATDAPQSVVDLLESDEKAREEPS
ncbi:hypothetical protein BBO99_00003572 [Phytophthora kernoviae]|uniref:Uncharacterized protein n=1 Tax=Phytophthora kernoviae TaxID=325452 RepID=A0A3R7J5P1_9STRA|nr:hypothetical protein BBI17_003650 [Phytophthora kernoviae]RLN81614.1 hypothetical protein BBO99_00003572 [Phytophthora kernoviae]